MKIRSYRIAAVVLFVTAGILLAGCALPGGEPAAKAAVSGTVPVKLSLASVNPSLTKALAARTAEVTTSAGRALMFMTKFSLSINDVTTGAWQYPADVYITDSGPGGGNNTTTVDLVAGDTYTIYAYGYNAGMSPYSAVVSGTREGVVVPANTTNYWIDITMAPSNLQYVSFGSSLSGPTNVWTDYWYKNGYYGNPDGYTLYPAVYDLSAQSNTAIPSFPVVGGERWLAVTLPYGQNTLTLQLTPTYNNGVAWVVDNNALIFVGTYDQKGNELGGFALSPNFTGTGSTPQVTISCGGTPGSYVYVGYTVIQATNDNSLGVTNPIQGYPYDMVDVSVLPPTLADDSYEYNYGSENDTSDTAVYFDSYNNTSIDAKAYDQDWYYFYAYKSGNYTFTLSELSDLGPWVASGQVQILDYYSKQNMGSLWGSGSNGAFLNPESTSVYLQAGSYYRIQVDIRGQDPTMGFPVLGGHYRLDVANPY